MTVADALAAAVADPTRETTGVLFDALVDAPDEVYAEFWAQLADRVDVEPIREKTDRARSLRKRWA